MDADHSCRKRNLLQHDRSLVVDEEVRTSCTNVDTRGILVVTTRLEGKVLQISQFLGGLDGHALFSLAAAPASLL